MKQTRHVVVEETEPGFVLVSTEALYELLRQAGWKQSERLDDAVTYSRTFDIPEEPTDGQRRVMIYRHHRRLEDACDSCGKSTTYCAANSDLNRARCCDGCSH